MLFTLTTLILAAISQTALATPLTSSTNFITPTDNAITNGANFPVHDLGSVTAHPNITLGADGTLHIDTAQQTFPATLLLCPSANCASCGSVNLQTVALNTCFTTTPAFTSVAISQPSNEGLPFAVAVGTPNCVSLLQIPAVNTCFNINGGALSTFALLD